MCNYCESVINSVLLNMVAVYSILSHCRTNLSSVSLLSFGSNVVKVTLPVFFTNCYWFACSAVRRLRRWAQRGLWSRWLQGSRWWPWGFQRGQRRWPGRIRPWEDGRKVRYTLNDIDRMTLFIKSVLPSKVHCSVFHILAILWQHTKVFSSLNNTLLLHLFEEWNRFWSVLIVPPVHTGCKEICL